MWVQTVFRRLGFVPSTVFAGVAAFLIVTDIIDGHWSLSGLLLNGMSGDIKQYVLFTRHKYNTYEVVTGIQFASSSKRVVEKQWCYISKSGGKTASNKTLTLATVDSTKTPKIGAFDKRLLAAFDLTNQALKQFIKSHCRFQ